jgi:S1-C subfamily serine protease
MSRFSGNDCDKNSMKGDPLFIDPSKCDFRVQEDSPALKTGFVNFEMNQFGVTKPSLKAIAKSPEIPVFTLNIGEEKQESSKPTFTWMGVQLKEPMGNELSAYGISFDSGGVALPIIPENSAAAKLGFRNGDLIQQINGFKVKNILDLKSYIGTSRTAEKKHVFLIVRNQSQTQIIISLLLPEVLSGEN